jgi:inosine/xanthosine triphosphatase
MKRIVLASHNPVKAQATEAAFRQMFPGEEFALEPVSVNSGVRVQPLTDLETQIGAGNRARQAMELREEAAFWVGIEGGVEETEAGMIAFAWVVVLSRGRGGKGRTGAFFLPENVAQLVRAGKELGEADDIIFGRDNSKQQEGAVGILTAKVIGRARLYEQAVVLALIPFKNPELYPGDA